MTYDRYGNPPDDQPAEHACTNGWLGEDPDGRPRPCLICKPHLAPDRIRHRAHIDDHPPERTDRCPS